MGFSIQHRAPTRSHTRLGPAKPSWPSVPAGCFTPSGNVVVPVSPACPSFPASGTQHRQVALSLFLSFCGSIKCAGVINTAGGTDLKHRHPAEAFPGAPAPCGAGNRSAARVDSICHTDPSTWAACLACCRSQGLEGRTKQLLAPLQHTHNHARSTRPAVAPLPPLPLTHA